MSTPNNERLYEQVKREIYEKYPKHSAYRSGLLVQEYKKRGGGYIGQKNKKSGLSRWFGEEWKNQRGETGYKYKSDVYRPTKRINKNTPKTFNELSKADIEKAKREKLKNKRVKRFG